MADFLLVHGMCAGSWEWERVISALQADPRAGRIVAPDMPGRGPDRPRDLSTVHLADYFTTILTALRDHDLRDVILVGHSGGGICLQAVAAAEPERVRRLVFLCAAIPTRGQGMLDLQPRPLRLLGRLFLRAMRAERRGIVPSRRLARRALCHTLTPEDCALFLPRLVPEPRALLTDSIDWDPARVPAPAIYILTTQDRIIRPPDQLRMAATVPGIEIIPIDAGHADPVAYPERLVEMLLQYA